MKKTYIAPALRSHQIHVESMLLGESQRLRIDFGNKKKMKDELDPSQYEFVPDVEQYGIDPVEGDDWGTL